MSSTRTEVVSAFRRLAGVKVESSDDEEKLRQLLWTRAIDRDTTAEAAKKAGLSVPKALKLLNKFADDGFTAEDGAVLRRSEDETRRSRGAGPKDGQPKKFVWSFM